MTILALSGSLRAKSFNTMLARAAAAHAPVEIESIRGIPLYDGDVETAGTPPAVVALKDRLAAAKGLLLVTPEYNNSIPGTFKNAIDWLTRPAADIPRVWHGLVTGVMGATPGPGGTALAQAAWLPILRTLNTLPFFGVRLQVPGAGKVFDADGKIVDAAIEAQLAKFMTGFVAYVEKHGR